MDIEINDHEIDNRIKFETSSFREECLKIYWDVIDANIKKAYGQLQQKIESDIKTNTTKFIGSRCMFDYSRVPGIKEFKAQNGHWVDLEKFIRSHLGDEFRKHPCPTRGKSEWGMPHSPIGNFLVMAEGEKVVVYYHTDGSSGINSAKLKTRYVLVTNYGKVLVINRQDHETIAGCFEFQFWIPTDYIALLQKMTTREVSSRIVYIPGSNFLNLLQLMKETLYDRRFVPLYVKDVVEENKMLRAQYGAFEKEKEEFRKRKEEFERDYKPHLDLIKDIEYVKKKKEELRLVALKLQTEREQLEREKKRINSLDVNDILND